MTLGNYKQLQHLPLRSSRDLERLRISFFKNARNFDSETRLTLADEKGDARGILGLVHIFPED